MNRLWLGVVVVSATLAASGCAVTVPGAAVRDPKAGPNVVALTADQLDSVLLPVEQVEKIVGSTSLRVALDADHLSDPPGTTSKSGCIGAIYGGIEEAYQDADATDIRDQVLKEPDDSGEYWVEQTAVLHRTESSARKFVESSAGVWQGCAGALSLDEDGTVIDQRLGEAVVRDGVLRQDFHAADDPSLVCQHALAAAANLTVETFVCSVDTGNKAVEMTKAMLARAAKK
jgi:hypothetical protein